MKKMLYEVDLDKGIVITGGNKEYSINPGDLPTVACWLPTANLEIEQSNGITHIKNCSINETVSCL